MIFQQSQKKNVAADFEEGEAQKAVFSKSALIISGIVFLGLGAIVHFVFAFACTV